MNLMIKDKVAVVTGASKGLGRAVAEVMADEGAHVVICSRKEDQIIKAAREISDQYKVDVLPFVCDVTNMSDIEKLKNGIIEKHGTCHILFTNAGGPPSGNVKDFTSKDFKKAIDLNLISTINLVYAFLPYMQNQRWGRIIASTSSNVRHLLPQFPLSNVSRIGVVSFIKTLAPEIAPFHITANVLAPGLFLTDPTKKDIQNQARTEGISNSEMHQRITKTIPTQTIGNPKDFGSLAAYMASEQASFITGETILIDGGKYSGVI